MLGFTRNEDLKSLNRLLDELAGVLETRLTLSNNLCDVADSLLIDDYQHDNKPDRSKKELQAENEQLRVQLQAQTQKYQMSIDHLEVCIDMLTRCIAVLRDFSHSKTTQAIATHRKYTQELAQAEDTYINLFYKRSALESRLYNLSRTLGVSLRQATATVHSTTSHANISDSKVDQQHQIVE